MSAFGVASFSLKLFHRKYDLDKSFKGFIHRTNSVDYCNTSKFFSVGIESDMN